MAASKRRRQVELGAPQWRATMNGTGAWVIVNREGDQPLRDPDPVVRIQNIHLAAAAPTLREALELLVRRFERLNVTARRDVQLLQLSWGAIILTRPELADVMRVLPRRAQQELELDEAA